MVSSDTRSTWRRGDPSGPKGSVRGRGGLSHRVGGVIGVAIEDVGLWWSCEQTYRNGYRDRELKTRMGALNLRVPKLRTGSYFPGFPEPRRTSEKALVAVIQEAWIGGVSTRKVDDLVQAMDRAPERGVRAPTSGEVRA